MGRPRDAGSRAGRQGLRRREVLSPPAAAPIEVRAFEAADLDFVRELDADALGYGVPPTRDTDPAAVRARALAVYADPVALDALLARCTILVAERRAAGGAAERVGFIRLDLDAVEGSTGEPQGFIEQLAVARPAWGGGVASALVDAAARLCAARGLDYLAGVVTAANERTLRVALGTLDFVVERHQIVKRCR